MRMAASTVSRALIVRQQVVVVDALRPVELLEDFASGTIATLALISDVPPKPEPLITEISVWLSSSYRPSGFRSLRVAADHAGERLPENRPAAIPCRAPECRWRVSDSDSAVGQPRRRDGAAVTRPDDHDVVRALALFPRCG